MLAPALRRHVDHGAFEQFEHGLLHAFARDVAGDGGVVAFAGYLVYLVDEDDASLGIFHIVVGSLQESHKHILDIVAHIAGLGEGGGIGYAERHVEYAGDGACHEGFAGACLAHDDDVGFLYLHIFGGTVGGVLEAFVVVVDGHGERTLGVFLPDDILVEVGFDFSRCGDVGYCVWLVSGDVFLDHLGGLLGAGVAYIACGAGDKHAHLRFGSSAEGAAFFVSRFLGHVRFFFVDMLIR